MPIAISILGVTGKMGKCLLTTALQDPELRVVAGTTHPQSFAVGKDLGELLDSSRLNVAVSTQAQYALSLCEVAIDFSTPQAAMHHVHAAKEAKKALVIGTTGLSLQERQCIENAAQDIPIIVSANFSLGISLCLEMAALLGTTLFGRGTLEIFETHHIHKKDQPSGTALALSSAIGRGKVVHTSFAQPRNKEEIAIHSQRVGETIGEHTLVFESDCERIEIKHTAHTRQAFAQGALLAAKALISRPAGLYTLKELFAHGFKRQ